MWQKYISNNANFNWCLFQLAYIIIRCNNRPQCPQHASLGDRSFSVAGPKEWNSLPATLRQPDVELGQFKRFLKTFLFGEAAAH